MRSLALATLIAWGLFGSSSGLGQDSVLTAEEKQILEMTNRERAQKGLQPLQVHAVLVKVARAHSANMAKQEKLTHDLDGPPAERVEKAGYNWGRVGENIAYGDRDYTPARIMKMWMESPAHRDNILQSDYAEIGVGIARDAKGRVYYTQVFGRLLK